jgi:hypothetical protein
MIRRMSTYKPTHRSARMSKTGCYYQCTLEPLLLLVPPLLHTPLLCCNQCHGNDLTNKICAGSSNCLIASQVTDCCSIAYQYSMSAHKYNVYHHKGLLYFVLLVEVYSNSRIELQVQVTMVMLHLVLLFMEICV